MLCDACRRYRAPWGARPPAFCPLCGHATTLPDRARIEADIGRLRYLLDELRGWVDASLIGGEFADRLAGPYRSELACAELYREQLDAVVERPLAPACHDTAVLGSAFCPDCGVDLAAWRAERTVAALPVTIATTIDAPVATIEVPTEPPALVESRPPPPAIEEPRPEPVARRRGRRLLRELRPVFYENLILFLGAFLMFAGSIYFAVYFWDRFGLLGPLVAGGLLAIYGLSFAGVGYLLQRRYRAELSARVLYAVATAILPIASTLLGEPIRTQGAGIAILSAGIVGVFGAATYPAILVAASLFQRDIGKPFARSFVALLWAIGLAPAVAAVGVHGVAVAYVYLAALPVLAMYRRVREVGRVFERATVIYVVGGSAYLVAAVSVRMSIAVPRGLAPAELAPLLVLVATAAIDLDVAWRRQSHAARSALGVVGVLAHGAAVVAIAAAFADPYWRVLTTISAGLVFAVTALRHRRPSAVHLAIATAVAGGLLVVWMPGFDPPHAVALGGAVLLPVSIALARLGARWRRYAALEFAVPCEQWAVLVPILAALCAALPVLGDDWQLAELGRWRAHVPALIVLPCCAAVLGLAWSWGRRRSYLAVSALAAAATVLTVAHLAGAEELGLAAASAALALALVGAAIARRPADAQGGQPEQASGPAAADSSSTINDAAEAPAWRPAAAWPALLDAALVLLATAAVIETVAGLGPWHGFVAAASAGGFALTAAAAAAVASQRPNRAIGALAVLGLAFAAAAVLWELVPRELVPGILAVGFLAIDRTCAGVMVGRARPLRDAYTIALAAVVLQMIAIAATTTSLASISPLAAGLVAVSLLAIAARHRLPWPTYGAVGFLVAAAWGAPAALGVAVRPRVAAEAVALVAIAAAVVLRRAPRLAAWRTTFLDVPLHIAAVAAPLGLARFLGSFLMWAAGDAPTTLLLLRRLAAPLGCALLAAITHGSRAHAYLAAATAMFVLPAAAVALGLDSDALAVAFAGAAVLAVIGARAIAQRLAFTASVERGDLPLRLFGYWPLPSAATHRVLWQPPIRALGLVAAFAAAALAAAQAADAWPAGSATATVTCALLAGYAIARCIETADASLVPALAAHAACAVLALLAAETAQLVGREPHGTDLVVFGAGFLVISEAVARSSHPAARAGGRATLIWAIACLLLPVTVLAHASQLITPVAAAILAACVIRVRQRYPMTGARTTASIATTAAGGFLVLWLLAQIDWLVPAGVACSALAITAALAAWLHWALRRPANLGEPFRLSSAWAVVGALFALASPLYSVPASAPALLPAVLALAALGLVAAWFGFAAIRTGRDRHGHAAQVALVLLYISIRTGPLGAGITAETDAIVAIAASFALHFTSELLRRAGLTALERPAVTGARILPLAACIVVLWLASTGDGALSTLEHAVLAETLGVLYTLGARRTGHRALGLVAMAFYNIGLALLWLATDQRDPLFYVVPLGLSISLLARIYRSHMSRSARRGLRAAGALLIYFATYYQVIQFDHGQYALWLGVFTLAGTALGFWLQLRELFLLSIGFLVLDVTSNLAYYGVHRPVLGWTLLTVAGLCLTVSGIVFQLRRSQVRGLLANARATMADWD